MKNLLTLTILVLTLTTGIFASPNKETEERVKINVAALKGPTGLSMVKLIHEKQSLGKSVETTYSVVNTPQLVTAGLLSGEYDIAALPTNLASIIFNKKPDYKLAAVTGEGTLYLITSRSDINSWKDLKDKKVFNIARSSTPGFLFSYLLSQNNIDPTKDMDIDFTYNHVELAPLLIAGKADTGILPEPLVTKVLLQNSEMQVALDFQTEFKRVQGSSSSYPLSCIVVKKELLENNPEAVQVFLRELENSINWVNSNPMEAGEMGQEISLGVTGPLIKKSISRLNLGFKSSQEAKEELESYYKVLFNSNPKAVGGAMPTEDFYMD